MTKKYKKNNKQKQENCEIIQFDKEEIQKVEINTKQGYIKLYRSVMNWEWYKNQNTKNLFYHCIMKANHQETKYQGITIPRGAFMTSQKKLSEETGLTIQEVKTAIKHLILTKELTKLSTRGKTQGYTLLKVNKYDIYQGINQVTNQDVNHGATYNKNEKKYINKKTPSSSSKNRDKQVVKPSKFCLKVMEMYNEWFGTNYTKNNTEPYVIELMNDLETKKKATLEDVENVIYGRKKAWGNDEKMKSYLTPSVIFGDKFNEYLQTSKSVQ